MSRPNVLVTVLFVAFLVWLWRLPSCSAAAAPYFHQADGGVVAWDGGAP